MLIPIPLLLEVSSQSIYPLKEIPMAEFEGVVDCLYELVLYGKERDDLSPDLQSAGDSLIEEIDKLSDSGQTTWDSLVELAKRCDRLAGGIYVATAKPANIEDEWLLMHYTDLTHVEIVRKLQDLSKWGKAQDLAEP
jgi:hypothetical protein